MDPNDSATLVRYAIKTYELKRRFYIGVTIYVFLFTVFTVWLLFPLVVARAVFDQLVGEFFATPATPATQASPAANDPAAAERKKFLETLRRAQGLEK